MLESHTHRENTRANTTIVRYLIANDGAFGSIHDEPDVAFYPTDLYVGFISGEYITYLIVIVVYERFHAYGCGFQIVGNLLMRDLDAMYLM